MPGEITTIAVADTESTGFKPEDGAKLLEIGLAFLQLPDDRESDEGWNFASKWSSFVEFTDGKVPPDARAVHHIDHTMVAPGAPNCRTRLAAVTAMLEEAALYDGVVWAFHNRRHDLQFLPELRDRPVICTWQCARHIWPDAPNHKNQTLRYWRDVEPPAEHLEGLDPHRAAYDAAITAAVLRDMLHDHSVEELLRLTETPVLLKICNFKKHKGQPWSEVPRDYLRWMKREGVGADDVDLQYTIDYYLAA